MKLLLNLKNLILERSSYKILVDEFYYNDNKISLLSTYHQSEERFGVKSFEEILDIYDNDNSLNLRIGVPNEMIKIFFKKNFEKINEKFNEIEFQFKSKFPRLLVIKNRKKQNEEDDNPEYFDFAEFIIQKNSKYKFDIITSAFSQDGFFLKRIGRSSNTTPRLTVESKIHFNFTINI